MGWEMICEKCRAEVPDDSNFCRECGNPLVEGKRSLFLVYKSLVFFELYLIVISLAGFGILYFNYMQQRPAPPPPPKKEVAEKPEPYKRDVFYDDWARDPQAYVGVPIQKGGMLSEIYKSKKGYIIGLKVETVPIAGHGGWAGSIYVICGRDVPEVGISDIVRVRGTGAGEKIITVMARPSPIPALKADSVEIVIKAGSAP